jgi:hypothetical protein
MKKYTFRHTGTGQETTATGGSQLNATDHFTNNPEKTPENGIYEVFYNGIFKGTVQVGSPQAQQNELSIQLPAEIKEQIKKTTANKPKAKK